MSNNAHKRELDLSEKEDSTDFKQTKRQQKKQKKSHAAALSTNKPTMSFDLNQINKRNNRYGIHVSNCSFIHSRFSLYHRIYVTWYCI